MTKMIKDSFTALEIFYLVYFCLIFVVGMTLNLLITLTFLRYRKIRYDIIMYT